MPMRRADFAHGTNLADVSHSPQYQHLYQGKKKYIPVNAFKEDGSVTRGGIVADSYCNACNYTFSLFF